jgi:hypothetical protein
MYDTAALVRETTAAQPLLRFSIVWVSVGEALKEPEKLKFFRIFKDLKHRISSVTGQKEFYFVENSGYTLVLCS